MTMLTKKKQHPGSHNRIAAGYAVSWVKKDLGKRAGSITMIQETQSTVGLGMTHRKVSYTTNPPKRGIGIKWDPYLPCKDRISTMQG